jgi:hypothetical protein
MRALLVVLAGVALLVGVASQPASAGKGTEIEGFIKRIGKFAVDSAMNPKPRGLCVCQDGSGDHTHVGVLSYDGQLGEAKVTVQCSVRGFYPNGSIHTASPCDTFEILSK